MSIFNHPHPGMMIREQVMEPLSLSVSDAANKLGVLPAALEPVLSGNAAISAELATGLERAGFSTARFWLALQTQYDYARLKGMLKGKTNGVRLSIEEINEAIAAAGATKGE